MISSSDRSKTGLFGRMADDQFEQVVFGYDRATGLRTIIAIHDTRLGPSLGGCRFYPYTDEQSALRDVMDLARAMTYKAALAGLKLGGGKSVIIGNPATDKTPALWNAFGKVVDRLNGAYITTEDSGTSPQDMEIVRKATKHVKGTSSGAGDPSPITAIGITEGIRACVQYVYGSPDLAGKKIALQGVGHVGLPLARQLKKLGAHLIVTDKNKASVETAVRELGAEVAEADEIFGVACDVFSPCAMGGAVNETTAPKLKAKIVAGAANNQLSSPEIGKELMKRGIVYAPDFAINAGGLIHVAQEIEGYDRAKVEAKTKNIFNTITGILERSKAENVPPAEIAIRLAKERLEKN